MSEGHVKLESLTKRFDDVAAVDEISVEIQAGEFFSLLGPSGCGKTTTLRMVAGFEPPTGGKILLDGIDVGNWAPNRRNVNTVFQSYALFPFLTVAENVAFGMKYKSVPKSERDSRVAEALELVQLSGLRGATPQPAVGRPATARRAGAGAGAASVGTAAGRAPRGAGCQASPHAPGRVGRAAEAGGNHLPVRHPRPGRGAHDVRSPGRHEPRTDRPARHPGRGLQRARRCLRGRLPGRVEPDGRSSRARRQRAGTLPPARGRFHARGAGGPARRYGRCQARDPPGAHPPASVRDRRCQLCAGDGRAPGVPRLDNARLRPPRHGLGASGAGPQRGEHDAVQPGDARQGGASGRRAAGASRSGRQRQPRFATRRSAISCWT